MWPRAPATAVGVDVSHALWGVGVHVFGIHGSSLGNSGRKTFTWFAEVKNLFFPSYQRQAKAKLMEMTDRF